MISLARVPFARTVVIAFCSAVFASIPLAAAAEQDAAAASTTPEAAPAAQAPAQAEAPAPADTGSAPADAAAPTYDQSVPVDETAAERPAETAAPAGATKLEKVEVTGSRIKRTDYETAQPVVAISRQDIERTGIITLGELLQTLPSAGAALNTAFNNGGTGATEIDLRNLGCNRVLVLVNGHRWVNGLRNLATNCVDLNTIPIAIIDRIEVLQDGASAIYGSDAIAGVINVITRKDFQGTSISLQGGAYAQGLDGAQQNHSLSWGNLFSNAAGHTSIFANLNFQDEKGIPNGDRELSRIPKFNTGLTRASSFLPTGRFLFIPNQQNSVILNPQGKCPSLAGGIVQGQLDGRGVPITLPPAVGTRIPAVNLCDLTHITGAAASPIYTDYRNFTAPADNYNYALDNLLTTPLQIYSGFFALNHKFDTLDNLSWLQGLAFSFEGLYTYRRSRQILAPQPICIGNLCPIIGGNLQNGVSLNQRTYIAANQAFNPFGEDLGRVDPSDPTNSGCDQYGTGANCVLGVVGQGALLFRPTQVGRRIQAQDVPTFFLRPAFSGNFDVFSQMISWDLGYSVAQSKLHERLFNSIRQDNLQKAVGPPSGCTGDCVPVDYLHGPSLTQQMIDYLRFTSRDDSKQTQEDGFVNLSTSIDALPAGPIGIAAGFEYRRDHYQFVPDIYAQTGVSGGLFSEPTSGSVIAREEYLELDVPLLKDLPLAKEVEINVAGRISHYKQFGNSTNGKAGLRWKPFDDLLLRGTYSSSFRAPNVGDLYLGQVQSFPILADPCVAPANGGSRTPGSNADTNCNADNPPVPNTVTQPNAQITSPFVGNPNLRPETSHSFSAGFVFSPSFARGLDLTVDVFRIYLNNFITPVDPQFVLDSCYKAKPGQRNYCDEVVRDPSSRRLQLVFSRFQNFAKLVTGGIDFNLGYMLPTQNIPGLENAGRFKFVASATFLSSYDQYLPSGPGMPSVKSGQTGIFQGGTGAAFPRWKINPSLTWTVGGFEATWNTRILSAVMEPCDDGIKPTLTDLGLCSDPNHKAPDGSPAPLNRMKTGVKHDVQVSYRFAPSRLTIGFGAQNVFNADPPVSYSAFANSYDPSDYWVPGTLLYMKVQKDF